MQPSSRDSVGFRENLDIDARHRRPTSTPDIDARHRRMCRNRLELTMSAHVPRAIFAPDDLSRILSVACERVTSWLGVLPVRGRTLPQRRHPRKLGSTPFPLLICLLLMSSPTSAIEAWERPTQQEQDAIATQEQTPQRPTLSPEEIAAGFRLLFDGHSLAGWRGNLEVFKVVDDAIVGGNLEQALPNNEFLRSEQTYENFELRLQFKLVGEQANAGVQIRTSEIPDHHEVIGYQADMGDGWWGCLYDESRRNRVLAGPPAEQRDGLVKADEWNDYRILCEGPRIRLWINDQPTVDYTETDDTIPRRGIVALQIHSGPPAVASYRHIRLKVLD